MRTTASVPSSIISWAYTTLLEYCVAVARSMLDWPLPPETTHGAASPTSRDTVDGAGSVALTE